ncbi:MAG: XdhC family protein [Anaerolineae bacterium]|nr:XdhC family protein [Anaerolineae bacterium]
MRDIAVDLRRWRAEGKGIALATIVETRGSSLRPTGSRMALTTAGEVTGSVSSGCVDGDTVAEMEAILTDGVVSRRPFFGVSDEQAWGAGLACGGSLDVLVEGWSPIYDILLTEVEAKRPVGFASLLESPSGEIPVRHILRTVTGDIQGTLGDSALDAAVLADMATFWPGPHAGKHDYPQGEVFVEVIPPPPTLLVFGATDIAVPLVQMGRLLDFQVIVSDARRTFLRAERFPGVEQRFGWPQDVFTSAELTAGWAVVVLFHDIKFDVPALTLVLKSEAYYIGFLGSRKTQDERMCALLDSGFTETDWARVHGPVGLDIGGKEPAMIALSIMAEVVAVRHRRSGGLLRQTSNVKRY